MAVKMLHRSVHLRAVLFVSCGLLHLTGVHAAAPGVNDESIVFGQSACFTGPNLNLGCHYRQGILAAFEERNKTGGVLGRRLELVSLDDGYESHRAAANAERFAMGDDVLAVIGSVGTPTAKRMVPILRDAAVPTIGLYTGAEFLFNAERYPNVVNLRAGYADEVQLLVEHMHDVLGKRRFGVIYQDDAFGRSVLGNYKAALERYGLFVMAKATYTRNTHAFHSALFQLAPAELDAVLLVGSNAVNGELINLINALDRDYVMANLSFVNSSELNKQVKLRRNRVYVAEVMPPADDESLHIVRRFRSAMAAATLPNFESCPQPDASGITSLEGYVLGRFLIAVLERVRDVDALSRENLLRIALTAEPVLLDDWVVHFDPGSNAGSRYVRLIDLEDLGSNSRPVAAGDT